MVNEVPVDVKEEKVVEWSSNDQKTQQEVKDNKGISTFIFSISMIIIVLVTAAAITFGTIFITERNTKNISEVITKIITTSVTKSFDENIPKIRQAIVEKIDEKNSVIQDTIKEGLDSKIKEKVIETPFHIVKIHETLYGISRMYNVKLDHLIKANKEILDNTNMIIYPGMGLRLPQ